MFKNILFIPKLTPQPRGPFNRRDPLRLASGPAVRLLQEEVREEVPGRGSGRGQLEGPEESPGGREKSGRRFLEEGPGAGCWKVQKRIREGLRERSEKRYDEEVG